MPESPNVDAAEIARFQSAASRWWDPEGEMRPLHELNPVRLAWVERAGALAGRSVVDVGCGGGLLAEAMARAGARVTGLDLASDLLDVARLHAIETGTRVDYRLESAETHAATHAGQYDVVTCMEMLEHVPDPAAVVRALATLVRPRPGVRLDDQPQSARLAAGRRRGRVRAQLLPRGTHTYEKFIRPSELAAWTQDAGLELVDVAGLDYDPFARSARLTDDARVNYVARFHRPAGGLA